MKKVWILFLFFSVVSVFPQQEPNLAQYKTSNEKLKAWLKYTNEILNLEDYPKLIVVAQKGVELDRKSVV